MIRKRTGRLMPVVRGYQVWTRRKFLGTSLAGPLGTQAALSLVTEIEAAPQTAPGLNSEEQSVLRAAMDEIVPASDNMPAASQVGGLAYLQNLVQRDPAVATAIRTSLNALEAVSKRSYGQSFDHLSTEHRISALRELEKTASADFSALRDYVYEAYYTQPKVWNLIGYKFYPTDHPGPHMQPFDEAVIAHVAKKPKFYREA